MVTRAPKPKADSKKNSKESSVKQEGSATLAVALKHFETTEANLVKLERLWKEIRGMIPDHVAFGPNPEHEEKCRIYKTILPHLPRIDGWSPSFIASLNKR